jgi:hypothetical protein
LKELAMLRPCFSYAAITIARMIPGCCDIKR